jgi:hypothetical protein
VSNATVLIGRWGKPPGFPFDDTDPFKVLEGAVKKWLAGEPQGK